MYIDTRDPTPFLERICSDSPAQFTNHPNHILCHPLTQITFFAIHSPEHRRLESGDWVRVPKYRSSGCHWLPDIYGIQKAQCPTTCQHIPVILTSFDGMAVMGGGIFELQYKSILGPRSGEKHS
jgi:hypothetical protein